MPCDWFRLPLSLACAVLALAQPTAPQEPVEAAIRAVRLARPGAMAAARASERPAFAGHSNRTINVHYTIP